MSVIFNRKKGSIIFDKPQTTTARIKIQQAIRNYKEKFKLNPKSIQKQINPKKQRLSLFQVQKIQELHRRTKRGSLTNLLKSYDRNCQENIIEPLNTIDQGRLEMFRSGVYYRSKERAHGSGLSQISMESIRQYYDWIPNKRDQQKSQQKPIPRKCRIFSSIVI